MTENNLKFIKNLSWDEVFDLWRENEVNLKRWTDHYKERGFSSWDEWRKDTLQDFNGAKLGWELFEVVSPMNTIPLFMGGPFRAWISKYYKGKNSPTFAEIINNEELQKSEVINQMINNFPKETNLVGLKTGKGVVILEGMHRCCAIALANKKHHNINMKVFIALAEYNDKIPVMGQKTSPTQ